VRRSRRSLQTRSRPEGPPQGGPLHVGRHFSGDIGAAIRAARNLSQVAVAATT